jgi:type II secretory pathway pseudopilin PulG
MRKRETFEQFFIFLHQYTFRSEKPMRPQTRCHFSKRSLSRPFPAGFTLIETMIVFLLLGIVGLLCVPMLGSALKGSKLSGSASDVVTALEYAQIKAINAGRDTRVTFDVAADTVLVEHFKSTADFTQDTLSEADVEGGAFTPMGHPLTRGTDYSLNLANQALLGGVDVTAVDFGGANVVTYDAMGAPSSGGTVTLTYGSRQMVVTLDALSGKVTVSE